MQRSARTGPPRLDRASGKYSLWHLCCLRFSAADFQPADISVQVTLAHDFCISNLFETRDCTAGRRNCGTRCKAVLAVFLQWRQVITGVTNGQSSLLYVDFGSSSARRIFWRFHIILRTSQIQQSPRLLYCRAVVTLVFRRLPTTAALKPLFSFSLLVLFSILLASIPLKRCNSSKCELRAFLFFSPLSSYS